MAGTTLWPGTLSLVLLILPALSHGSPCTVVVDQHQYDLSSLATQDYWEIRLTKRNGEDMVVFFSLCHPLRNGPSGCAGNDSSVCIMEESNQGTNKTVTVPNAGRVSSNGPTFTEGQMVEYVMEDGDLCPEAGGQMYHTYVNFICAQTPETETGPQLMSITRCQLLVAWMTQAACPHRLDVVTDTPCTIHFPSSAHNLHLQTLRAEQFYSAVSYQPNAKYEINICGSVVNGTCDGNNVSVCHLPEGGSPQVLATTHDMNVRWEQDEILTLTYQPTNQGKKVEIQFMCYRTAAQTRINYVTQNDSSVSFVVRTSAVCPPTPAPDCVLEDDEGNVYDLRPLHRVQDNWEVVHSTTDGQAILYFLNICGPVNPGRHYTCPPGLIGACMAGRGADAAYNLGLLNSEPTINTENGTITIMYNGGEPCKGGQHSHSTRINLVCSSEEHGPVLVRETETCEHVFDWLTPVACPRHLTTGTHCQVNDPLYGNEFDLNPLRNIHQDYKMTNDGDEFLINLCGPLVSSCGGQNGTSGVCQITNGQQINSGLSTTQLTFNDGTLMMKYTNGSNGCQGNDTRSSQVIFLCDHEVSGRDGPMFSHQIECTNSFFWKTKYACPSFRKVDCTLYTAEGMMYDLQELSSSDSNLEYYTTDQKKFVLNVCRSVVHQKGSRCAYRAGSCIVDSTHLNTSVNIGEVQSGPYLQDGKLMMRYEGGDQCAGHTQLYQTLIEFKCDKTEIYPFPQLIGEENCTYYFEIRSAAGCPVSVENVSTPLSGRDCTVTSPTGYTFDLSSLKRETDYVVQGSKNMTLTLNVCGALNNPKCQGESVGICSNNVNAGQANANLNYLPQHLSLHYTGGEECREDVHRSTIITFVCGAENVTEGPVLVFDDTDQCMYFITWYTELACEKRISCFVDTWTHRIDLSPLIKSTSNYEAVNSENPKEKFYLNVCRPLNPIIGLNCRPGSAVCISSRVEGKNPLSLGHPDVTPVADGGGATIMYTHGAKCPSEPNYNFSSKIHFVCDPTAGKGNPVFKEMTHDCQYQFEWRTSVACDISFKEEELGPQCQIRYDQAKANIDLKPLYRPEGYQVQFGNKNFTVNVCGPACNTSGSCSSDGESYGLSNNSELEWHHDELTLKFYGGSPCYGSVSGHAATTILFICNMSAGFGYPVVDDLMGSIDCLALFQWKTNVTCIEGIYATEASASPANSSSTAGQNNPSKESLKDKTTSTHSPVSAIIATILVVSCVAFVVALVIMKTRRGNHIVVATRRLFGIHRFGHSQQVQVENSTLLGATNSIRIFRTDDSDDDLLRV